MKEILKDKKDLDRAKILKTSREKIGLTLKNVKEQLEKYDTSVSEATLQRYETGEISRIPLKRINALANIYQTTPAHLMGWDEHTPAQKDDLISKIKEVARSKNINVAQIKEKYNIKNEFDYKLHTNTIIKIAKDFGINTNKVNYLSNSKNSKTLDWFIEELNKFNEEQLKQLKNLVEPIFTLIKSK